MPHEPASQSPPGVAQDAQTITEVLTEFEGDGYTGQFFAAPQSDPEMGRVQCATCHVRTPASDMMCSELRRLEGASNPDDMLAIAAVQCPRCGTRGTLVLNYGPTADEHDDAIVLALPCEWE